jgi:hypothetical protein
VDEKNGAAIKNKKTTKTRGSIRASFPLAGKAAKKTPPRKRIKAPNGKVITAIPSRSDGIPLPTEPEKNMRVVKDKKTARPIY